MLVNHIVLIALAANIASFIECKYTVIDSKDSNLTVGSIGFKRLSEITELCEVNDDFLFRTNEVQLRMNLDKFECLSKIRFNCTLKTTTLTSLSVKQWILWEVDRFNPKDKVNWIPDRISSCGNSSDSFLGGPCNLAAGSVKRFYNNLPTHAEIKITGRVHFFDEWNESHNWCPSVTDSVCRKFGIDVCGTEYPDRLSVNFDVSMPHDSVSLVIEFSSSLDAKTQACVVSWGIDDIALHLR
ncbi:hypothetical protein MACJ_000599 [Theileria orientalis]|uniref:Uncharacterized protein n=1 Tax=Theileria orientalis TaxID=68886 RepID=A0A976M4B0_THEOR|nr:hypothetical protein MACJ_000599 [Theileria orientalis]